MFFYVKSWLLSKLSTPRYVKLAQTPEQLDAICRFRYQVYYQQFKKTLALEIDHENQRITDHHDLADYASNYYIKRRHHIVATIRVLLFPPNKVPAELIEEYKIDQVVHSKGARICIVNFLLSKRKSVYDSLALVAKCYEVCSLRKKTESQLMLAFFGADPGLTAHYQMIGARRFTDSNTILSDGIRVPMVVVPQDFNWYLSARCFFYDVAKKYYDHDALTDDMIKKITAVSTQLDLYGGYLRTLQNEALEKAYSDNPHIPDDENIFKQLTLQELRKIVTLSLHIHAGELLLKRGVYDKEIYIIAEGEFDIVYHGKVIRTLTRGNVIGEIAFFSKNGFRSASTSAKTNATLLVVKRSFIDKSKSNKIVIKFLRVMATIMSRRVILLTESLLDNRSEEKEVING